MFESKKKGTKERKNSLIGNRCAQQHSFPIKIYKRSGWHESKENKATLFIPAAQGAQGVASY